MDVVRGGHAHQHLYRPGHPPPCSYAIANPTHSTTPCHILRKECHNEPTAFPNGDRPGHRPNGGPNTLNGGYMLCYRCKVEFHLQRGFKQVAENTLATYIYQDNAGPNDMGPVWRLRDTAYIRHQFNILQGCQSHLCDYCEADEVALFRWYQQDPANFIRGPNDYSQDGPRNSCLCYRRYMGVVPWYCDTCSRSALDERQILATENMRWLMTIGRTQAGNRRFVTPDIINNRAANNTRVPCRCGREVAPRERPKATFCLCCAGVKIWEENLEEPRYPTRGTRNVDAMAEASSVYELENSPQPGFGRLWLIRDDIPNIKRVHNGV